MVQKVAGYWDLVEPIWEEVSFHGTSDAFLSAFNMLPEAVGDLFAAHWMVSEVENGAFPQFFSNATGMLAPEAVAALERIGLEDAAQIAGSAMDYFGPAYPRAREERAGLIDWVWEEEMTEEREAELEAMLDLSEQFLDAIGKDRCRFEAAADAYAQRHATGGKR